MLGSRVKSDEGASADLPHSVQRDEDHRRVEPVRAIPPLARPTDQLLLRFRVAPISPSPVGNLSRLVLALSDLGEWDVGKGGIGRERIWCNGGVIGIVDAGGEVCAAVIDIG